MNNISYSFIIPHHNTPDLLERLIATIPQREDIEVIVVDDNSEEGKRADINRPDVKTIYIDKEHTRGAGHARNVGMDAAKGKWLLFADADDLYIPDFIKVLDKYKNEDIEVLYFNIDSADTDTLRKGNYTRSLYYNMLYEKYDGSENNKIGILYFNMGPWDKMVRAAFVKKYGIRFEEIVISNDSFFSFQIGYFVKNFKVDKRKLYVLTFTPGSITYSTVTKEKYSTALNIYRRRAKLFNYMGYPEWNKKSIRGIRSQSCIKYIYKLYKTQPIMVALKALFYYITHYLEIERNSNYYVNIVKGIEKRSKFRSFS